MGKGIAASLIAELHDIRRIHMIKARGPEKVMTMRAGDIAIMGGEGALPIIREPIMPGEVMGGEGAVEKSLKSVSEKSRCLLREENAGGSEGTQISSGLSPAPAVSADKAKLAT